VAEFSVLQVYIQYTTKQTKPVTEEEFPDNSIPNNSSNLEAWYNTNVRHK
jgi:hypothetical protein